MQPIPQRRVYVQQQNQTLLSGGRRSGNFKRMVSDYFESETNSNLNSRSSVQRINNFDSASYQGGAGRMTDSANKGGGAYFENNNQQPLLHNGLFPQEDEDQNKGNYGCWY